MIIDLWPPVIGGSQTHVWQLSSRLVKDYGCEIDIFTRALIDDDQKIYKQSEEHFEGKLRIFRVKPATTLTSPLGRFLTIATIAIKTIRENQRKNYSLIHSHSIMGGLIGKIVSLATRKPHLFTVHGSPNLSYGTKNFHYFIEKQILTKISYSKVISVTKDFLKFPNINSEINIIPNGIDVHKFNNLKTVKKTDFFKILFVGRLDWPKGINTLIEAVKQLTKNHSSLLIKKKIQIHLIGYGFKEAEYIKKVTDNNLNNFIKFRGKIVGDELIFEYKSSHLFILPSICEGQPITLLEALACRLPVLTTEAADNAQIITPDIGWKVESDNSIALADKILEIIQLPARQLETMGLKGYEKIAKDHSLEIIAKKTFDIYLDLA